MIWLAWRIGAAEGMRLPPPWTDNLSPFDFELGSPVEGIGASLPEKSE